MPHAHASRSLRLRPGLITAASHSYDQNAGLPPCMKVAQPQALPNSSSLSVQVVAKARLGSISPRKQNLALRAICRVRISSLLAWLSSLKRSVCDATASARSLSALACEKADPASEFPHSVLARFSVRGKVQSSGYLRQAAVKSLGELACKDSILGRGEGWGSVVCPTSGASTTLLQWCVQLQFAARLCMRDFSERSPNCVTNLNPKP